MKSIKIERVMASLFTHKLEKAIPEKIDLWPTISARLTGRNLPTELQRPQGSFWSGFCRVRMASAIMGIMVGIIGLYLWTIHPNPVNAQEILNRAQDARVLSSNSNIYTFTLTQKIDERSSAGKFHIEIKRWYQKPGRWRVESRWTGIGPSDEGTRTDVCDGASEWIQQGNSIIINRATQQPETEDPALWGREIFGLTDIPNQVCDIYPYPNLQGEETIAGRLAYVIDLGLPNRYSNSAPELNNGRRVIWVDKETFFLLKVVQYSPTDDSVAGAMEVTQIQYNIPIDPGVFSFSAPPGAQVQDLRSGNYVPKPSHLSLTGLTEARQKVSFSIFIPTVVPSGLVSEPPTFEEGPPAFVRINYCKEDGSTGLSVLNGPAGNGLAADPRKKGEVIKLRGNIPGHFLNNEPQFGGPILWWEEAGSYVALSGPELNKTALVKIADSMSSTADTK